MARNNSLLKSILIVDDDADSLDLYSHLLNDKIKAHISSTKFPTTALKLAYKHFFDIILIDVTINYNGTPFGGFELYKNLMGRYGDSSLIVYSQYITDDLLRQYEYDFNFIEKGSNSIKFIDDVLVLMNNLRKRQSCFVAMPFNEKYGQIYQVIKDSVELASYQCIRVDQQNFTKSIIEKIFIEIGNAKLIAFLATDQNPNAFYECGYAMALDKEIITLTDIYKNLPFDIRDRNAIAYGNDLKKLKSAMDDKLLYLTHMTLR